MFRDVLPYTDDVINDIMLVTDLFSLDINCTQVIYEIKRYGRAKKKAHLNTSPRISDQERVYLNINLVVFSDVIQRQLFTVVSQNILPGVVYSHTHSTTVFLRYWAKVILKTTIGRYVHFSVRQ